MIRGTRVTVELIMPNEGAREEDLLNAYPHYAPTTSGLRSVMLRIVWLAVALAQEMTATVVTGDPEFKRVESLVKIMWL